MKAYKASYNQVCKDQEYEVGETYTLDGKLIMCENGFHFCQNPDDVFNYYPLNKNFVLFEVEPLGKIITQYDKSVTDKIKMTRIVPHSEWNNIFTKHEFDDNKNLIYQKETDGYEEWHEYDEHNNEIHYRNSDDFEEWYEYDEEGRLIHLKDSYEFEVWYNYDDNDNVIINSIPKPTVLKKETQHDRI